MVKNIKVEGNLYTPVYLQGDHAENQHHHHLPGRRGSKYSTHQVTCPSLFSDREGRYKNFLPPFPIPSSLSYSFLPTLEFNTSVDRFYLCTYLAHSFFFPFLPSLPSILLISSSLSTALPSLPPSLLMKYICWRLLCLQEGKCNYRWCDPQCVPGPSAAAWLPPHCDDVRSTREHHLPGVHDTETSGTT